MKRHTPPVSRARKLTASAVLIVGLTALALLAGAGLASTGSSSSAAYQYGKKVTICHRTHSKKHPFVTITVGQAAVKAHLKHGDSVGPCSSPSSVASKAKRAAKAKAEKAKHQKSKGKHKGSAKKSGGSGQAPTQPSTGSQSSGSHGKSGSHGNGNGKGNGHGKKP